MVNKLLNSTDVHTLQQKTNEVIDELGNKQDTLVSGTNIKTINNESILGSGNISISGGGTATDVQINGTSITSNNVANIITNSAYNASSNKIATMNDVESVYRERNIGEIVTSTIPLSDAGLHLLDGSLISGSGSYADFVDYIADVYSNTELLYAYYGGNTVYTKTTTLSVGMTLYDASGNSIGTLSDNSASMDLYRISSDGTYIIWRHTNGGLASYTQLNYNASKNESIGCFCSEDTWQTSVTNYGVCGKFVYDSVNNTVRLPKITGFVEGASGVSVLGDLTEAGLPNIKGSPDGFRANHSYQDQTFGAFTWGTIPSTSGGSGSGSYSSHAILNFDAGQYNPIYKDTVNTVQPQSVKVLYYIVIANSTKTEIEVDIDEIATDLNGKADVDLSNATFSNSVKNTIFGFGLPNYLYRININPSSATSGSYTTPAKGYICVDFTSYNKTMSLLIGGTRVSNRTSTSSYMTSLNGMYPVEKGKIVNFENGYIATTTYSSQGIYFVPIYANVGD
ncbi:MAG: hypothetical protein K6E29_09440 [Cyanobacteria bacterium RUI128]|nr:hypothetical protein [Cyanobacteria bacterium RUI128]